MPSAVQSKPNALVGRCRSFRKWSSSWATGSVADIEHDLALPLERIGLQAARDALKRHLLDGHDMERDRDLLNRHGPVEITQLPQERRLKVNGSEPRLSISMRSSATVIRLLACGGESSAGDRRASSGPPHRAPAPSGTF